MNTYSYGSSGEGVKKLQSNLKAAGYDLEEDGIYGDITKKAVADYQSKNELSSNGIANPETQASIEKSINQNQTAALNQNVQPENQAGKKFIIQDSKKKLSVLQNGYENPLDETIDTLYDKILNAPDFEYDPLGDPTYNQYAETYKKNAKLVSEDVMGQAAGLTGGYGSSYATAAASQAYNDQMSGLNDIVPELRQIARNEWQEDRTRDMEAISMLLNERNYDRSVFESNRAFDESVRQYNNDLSERQRQHNSSIANEREMIALNAGFASWDDYTKAVKNGSYNPNTVKTDNFTLSEVQQARNIFKENGYSGLADYISQLEQTGKQYSDEQFYSLLFNATGIDTIKDRKQAITYLDNNHDINQPKYVTDAIHNDLLATEEQWEKNPEYDSYTDYLRYTVLDILSE